MGDDRRRSWESCFQHNQQLVNKEPKTRKPNMFINPLKGSVTEEGGKELWSRHRKETGRCFVMGLMPIRRHKLQLRKYTQYMYTVYVYVYIYIWVNEWVTAGCALLRCFMNIKLCVCRDVCFYREQPYSISPIPPYAAGLWSTFNINNPWRDASSWG